MDPFTSPIFPVEVLVTIAEFLAGDGCLGTIASLNACSTLIHQETLSVLYETVDWTGDRRWWALDGARVCGGWRHIKFLKIQAREYESIQAYQTYLCSPKTYWSVAQSRYIDDRPLLPPTKNPAHDLGTIFPRLVLLIMVDDAAVDQAGVKVQKCAGRLVSPLALKTLLDSLGLLLNRSVPTSTSVSSSVEVISGETPQVVLSRLQVLGDGCINGADKTFVQAGTPCEANLPHRYHQVFDSNFELKLARTPSGDKEDGKTSLALLRTFSFRCVFLGGVEKVRLAISCESASFHSVTIAIVQAELLPCAVIIVSLSGVSDEQATTEGILRLGEAYANRWKSISHKAEAHAIFLRIYGTFCSSDISRKRSSSFTGHLRLLYRGSEAYALAVDVYDYDDAEDGDLQERSILQHEYPETRGRLLRKLPAAPFCPGAKPPPRQVPSPAPIAEGSTIPELTRGRTGTANSSFSLYDRVATHRGAQLNSGEVESGSSVTSGSAISARLPRLATSYGTGPTRRPRYI